MCTTDLVQKLTENGFQMGLLHRLIDKISFQINLKVRLTHLKQVIKSFVEETPWEHCRKVEYKIK